MMDIAISIIVPIYNLDYLLSKCVDSILAQTFTNFELILVNDGSTDNSGEMCEKYAEADSRVKVIHKENGGVASSRNAGLKVAQGKYIGFVDNDDFVNKFMFETLYNHAILHSSDIVICDFQEVDEGQSLPKEYSSDYKIQQFNNIEALNQLYTPKNVTFVVPWNKLYKRYLFNEIQYKHGNINDDETVAHKLLYYSQKITYIKTRLYYYVQRKGSQMDSSFSIKRFDAIYALKDREVFFRKVKEKDLHQKALKHYMERFFWYNYMAKTYLQNVDHELKDLKRTFDKSLFYLLKHRGISWKQKLMCLVFSISPSLFDLMKDTKLKRAEKQQPDI